MLPKARRAALVSIIFLLGIFSAGADILVFTDGEVIFGTIEEQQDGRLSVTSYGSSEMRRVKSSEGARKDTAALTGVRLEVMLRDGSVFFGAFADYDEGLGLFIDTSAGTLCIQFPAIRQVFLADKGPGDRTARMAFTVDFAILQPIASELFTLSCSPSLTFECGIPGSRALTTATSIEYLIMSYVESDQVRYGIMNVTLGLRMLLVPLFGGSDASMWQPYVQVGGGVAFVAVVDTRADAQNSNYGTLDAQARAELGLGVRILPRLSVRAFADIYMILQETRPFWLAGGGLSLGYAW